MQLGRKLFFAEQSRLTRGRLYYGRPFRASLTFLFSFVFLAFFFFLQGMGFSTLRAEEDWNGFLDALRARGYDDVALVYLNSLKANGSTPPELNQDIDYKIGEAALIACSKETGAERERLGEQARSAFVKYLETAPDGNFVAEANAGLGKLDAERGDRLLKSASASGVSAEDRDSKLLEARSTYSDAKTRLEASINAYKARVKSLQNEPQSNPTDLRTAQAAYLDLSLRLATVQAQTARTFAPDSEEYKNGLTTSADRFDKLFTTYQQYVGAFRARYEEAAIRWELGDADKALELLSELAVLPSEEQFVSLKTRSLRLYGEIADKRDLPDTTMTLVKKYNDWKSDENIPASHYDSAEGQEIALFAARAFVRLEHLRRDDFAKFETAGLKTFTDKDDPTFKLLNSAVLNKNSAKTNQIVVSALKILSELSSGRGAAALEAKEMLKDSIFEGIDLSKYSFAQKVDDFPSATAAAERDASAFSNARQAFQLAAPEAREEAKKELDAATRTALKSFDVAFEQGARAIRPDKKGKITEDRRKEVQTELDKLYLKRAVVCFMAERYEEAFALGEYLASRRAEFEQASQGALVSLRALQAIVRNARERGDDEALVASLQEKLDAHTKTIGERWGSEDAGSILGQETTIVQLDEKVESGDVEGARELLAKLPEDSPRRATAELQLGRACWNEWNKKTAELEAAQEGDGDVPQEERAKLDELLDGARQALCDGLEHKLNSSRGVQENDYVAIYSTHILAQVFEEQGNFEESEKWLTHPVIGALSVVERIRQEGADGTDDSQSDAIDDAFQMSTLALALRLATAKPDGFERAENYVSQLEEIVREKPENSGKLTGVYLQLGKRLEGRLRELKEAADAGDESKREELTSTTQRFESFLRRAAERDEGNGYGSTRWIADSYLSLANGLTTKMKDPSKEALAYYAEAGRTYQSIVKKIDADPSFAPTESAKLAVSLKIVECLRGAGAFNKAFDQVKKLVIASPDNLDIQLEAAKLFQDWGRKDPQYYLKSIVGGGSNGKGQNIVWGWNGVIKRLAPSLEKGERFKELYYEALLSKTSCRYRYAQSIKDAAEREKQARDAEKELTRLYQTHPDLGGAATYKKFDAAYKKFQALRGEKSPVGLNAKKKEKTVGTKPEEKK